MKKLLFFCMIVFVVIASGCSTSNPPDHYGTYLKNGMVEILPLKGGTDAVFSGHIIATDNHNPVIYLYQQSTDLGEVQYFDALRKKISILLQSLSKGQL